MLKPSNTVDILLVTTFVFGCLLAGAVVVQINSRLKQPIIRGNTYD